MVNLAAAVAAELVLFAAGISWLAIMTRSWKQAALFGLYPFLFAEVSKVMIAAAGAFRLRRSL
jgi:biotin transporter BioY